MNRTNATPTRQSAEGMLPEGEVVTKGTAQPDLWSGRFPESPLTALLDVSHRFNLAESTSRDLTLGEVFDAVGGVDRLRSIQLGYAPSAGLPELRQVIADRHGIPQDWIITTLGSALGLFLLAMELCRPGDQVILASPCFPPARDSLKGCGADIVEVPLRFSERYRLDPERIAALLSPRTKLVSLASPQNPSGITVSTQQLEEIQVAMAARAPEAWLFVDETYREAAYGNAEAAPTAAGIGPRVITGASISKAHGAPGLRVGWLTVPDAALRRHLISAKINSVVSGSIVGEVLATGLLANVDAILAPRRELLRQGLDVVSRWHKTERHRLDWVEPEAGALCCMRLKPEIFDTDAVARFWEALPQHSVQLAEGLWFGEEGRVFRLGFGYLPLGELKLALEALSKTMDGLAC